MTDEEAPILRWQAGKLLSTDGQEATDAQMAKARRYLKGGLIALRGTTDPATPWGMPSKHVETYVLEPVPGCRQRRTVQVTVRHDAAGNLTALDYECDCQRSQGTVARSPGGCSHALAVYLHRRDDTREA